MSLPPTAAPPTAPALQPVLMEPATAEERAAFAQLDLKRLPAHVAIIMDGNGRWARSRSLPSRVFGHRAGIDAVRASARTAAALRLRALTLYAFSKENWSRPAVEIETLMGLLDKFLVEEIPELMENNIRLLAMGELDDLRPSTRRLLERTMEVTAGNTGLRLNLALSYGGRQEILCAVRNIAARVASGEMKPADITEDTVSAHLYKPELGDPDVMIRTSGEMRVSNFLLWQIAYTELVVMPDVLWPDFRRIHFLRAIVEFQGRDRRFGRVDSSGA